MKKVKEVVLPALEKYWNVLKTKTVLKTDVVNNLTSTTVDAPLSANQGKILKDAINSLNENLGTNVFHTKMFVNCDLLEEAEKLPIDQYLFFRTNNTVTNSPYMYGMGVVMRYTGNTVIILNNMTDYGQSINSKSSSSTWTGWIDIKSYVDKNMIQSDTVRRIYSEDAVQELPCKRMLIQRISNEEVRLVFYSDDANNTRFVAKFASVDKLTG